MLKSLKLSHYHHSGKLQPHEHTSYLPLILLLMVLGFVLSVYTVSASPPPQAESVGLTGVVPAKPPTVGATITTPTNGQHFAISPVIVAGACPQNTLVEVFKSDIFAGSTPCVDGAYSLSVDLLIGQNTLISRVYDELNQPGPDSNAVTVFYDALPLQSGALTSFDFGGDQLLLNTSGVFRGAFPKQDLIVPIDIIGGRPPYAVNVQWGDSTNKIIARNDNVGFTANHAYSKAGTYQITLQATDADGRVAFLTVAAIVNGQTTIIGSSTTTASSNGLLALWPLYTATVAVVISFWLGERREKRVLAKHGLLRTV